MGQTAGESLVGVKYLLSSDHDRKKEALVANPQLDKGNGIAVQAHFGRRRALYDLSI
jgi:hypothetical protein